jgi:hypothetical protein
MKYGYSSISYDYDSIMQYSSWHGYDPELVKNDPDNPDFYPMVRLKDGKKSLIPRPSPTWEVRY